MIKKHRLMTVVLLVFMMTGSMAAGTLANTAAGTMAASLFSEESDTYAEAVEKFLAGLVPEEGLTIRGRTYGYEDVIAFMEEVRWAPDDYVHKSHHCALSELPEEDVRCVVQFLRILMRCPNTYTDYDTVTKVQEYLNQEGFDCGKVDGLLGVNTYAALRAYQAEHDLQIIDAITDELLEEMDITGDTSRT